MIIPILVNVFNRGGTLADNIDVQTFYLDFLKYMKVDYSPHNYSPHNYSLTLFPNLIAMKENMFVENYVNLIAPK